MAATATVNLYPIFLDLNSQPVLVVGAGRVAERKLRALLRAGARPTVIAPAATATIRRWADAGRLAWRSREYRANDMRRFTLVFAATNAVAVDRRVARDAARRGIPVNCATLPEDGSFHVPAQARRAMLHLAVSTGGESPALARRLARILGERLTEDDVAWCRLLSRLRPLVQSQIPPADRSRLWDELTGDELHSLLRDPGPRAAGRTARHLIRARRTRGQGHSRRG